MSLRLSTQRVAKFILYEMQEVLWGWLEATQREVAQDIHARALQEEMMPTHCIQWLRAVAALVNSIPGFVAQCEDLNKRPLGSARSASTTPQRISVIGLDGRESIVDGLLENMIGTIDSDILGPDTLPCQWSLRAEEAGFSALSEAMLWAMTDAVTSRLRRLAIGAPSTAAGKCTMGVGRLFKEQLDGSLQLLQSILEPSLFRLLLPKVFYVCLATYIVRLSKGQWFQEPPVVGPRAQAGDSQRDMQLFQLSEDTARICRYFEGFATSIGWDSQCAEVPWEPGKVLSILNRVISSPAWQQRRRQKPNKEDSCDVGADPCTARPDVDGLSRLVSVLADGALPLRQVLNWFRDEPAVDLFEDVPPMPPMGGFFLGDATPCLSRGSSSGDICSSPLTRSSRGSLPAPGRPKRQFSMPAISPFGLPSSGPASEVRRRKSEQHLSSVGGESQWSVRTAAAGGVCSLDVEHSGAYGVFCAVFRCQAMLTSAQCFMPSMRRWRWAQLYRASARAPPRFEVLRSKPSSAAAKDLVMLEPVPLQLLH